MSSTAARPPLKDPTRIPTAEDVDRHLNQFSRYARLVRGAARVAGLSTRLAWTHQGWVEQFRLDEAVLGEINLVRVPPVASIAVSRSLEEALSQRVVPDAVRHAIAKADGSSVKWVEAELTGPLPGDTMAAIISLKAELVKSGVVPLTAADRPKPVPRPEYEPPKPIRAIAAKPSVRAAAKPAKVKARPKKIAARRAKAKKPAKARKPARVVKAKKSAPRKLAAKSAKRR